MNVKRLTATVCLSALTVLISGCAPAQSAQPTITPSPIPTEAPSATPTLPPPPTATQTPLPTATPIPGIGTPFTVAGVGIQVISAQLGGTPPTGYTVKAGYTLLSVDIELSGNAAFADLLGKIDLKKNVAVVDNGRTVAPDFFNVPMTTMNRTTPPYALTIIFGVKKETPSFSLEYSDGQMVDLTPIMKSQ